MEKNNVRKDEHKSISILYKELENIGVQGKGSLNKSWLLNRPVLFETRKARAWLNKVNPFDKDQKSAVNFQDSMKVVLVYGQFLGLNPVTGIGEQYAHNLRFQKKSFKYIFSVLICLAQGAATLLSCLRITKGDTLTLGLTAYVSFYGSTCLTTVLFLYIAAKWPDLIQNVQETESADPCNDKWLKFKINLAAFVVLTLALIEHILSILSKCTEILDCYGPEDSFNMYMEVSFPWFYELGLWNNMYSLIFLQFLTLNATLNWNYSDVFIVCISIYLHSRLTQFNYKMRSARAKYLPESFWRKMREDFNRLSKLVKSFDNVLNSVIFVSFANNLYFICLQLFNTLSKQTHKTLDLKDCPYYPTGPFNGLEHVVYFSFSLIFLISRFVAVTLFAASVHSAALYAATVLYEVPSPVYGVEVQRFVDQATTNHIALTGLNFFSVTKGLLLSVANTIITYELVLLQLQSNDEPKEFTNNTVVRL